MKRAEKRVGDYCQTHGGEYFWHEDVREEDIKLEDIVASLPKICRYAGNTKKFYSVAEHSLRMAEAFPEYAVIALLHDAAEAYIGDIPSMVKSLAPRIKEIENTILYSVFHKYYVIDPAMWSRTQETIKMMDLSMLVYEKNHPEIMGGGEVHWGCIEDMPEPIFYKTAKLLPVGEECLTIEQGGYFFQKAINRFLNTDINIW